MKQYLIAAVFLLFTIHNSICQNTVGVINNTNDAYNGYTLFTNHFETFLINNCGEIINQWTSNYPPGNAVYLLEDGSLLRACKVVNPTINFGGTGGRIEKYNWEGDLIFEFNYSDNTKNQHHDIYPMPNGNILILAATIMSNSEALQAGRNPDLLNVIPLFNEQIIEIMPTGFNTANIVWEWNVKDHLVQDFDATKSNFGNVSLNPNKVDINYLGDFPGQSNWLHINSIQYYELLDQIVISTRHLSEIWIIDHSTTTIEASGSSGGLYGKGGDLLYRWGNPESYRQGDSNSRKLYGQHYPHFIQEGLLDAGKIIVFNNGFFRQPAFSEVFIINPPTTAPGFYDYVQDSAYGPVTIDFNYSDLTEVPSEFYSAIVSGAQRLPNNNILICEGREGRFFEINSENEIVWEYINPVNNDSGEISSQGNAQSPFNLVFRATKYSLDYPAFDGRDLTPGNPIELNSEINAPCSILSLNEYALTNLKLSPNPTSNIINIETTSVISKIEVYNILGSKINTVINTNFVDLTNFESGMYLLKLFSDETIITKRVIKD